MWDENIKVRKLMGKKSKRKNTGEVRESDCNLTKEKENKVLLDLPATGL